MKKLLSAILTLCLLCAFAQCEPGSEGETLLDRVLRLVPDAAGLVRMSGDDLYDLIGIDPESCVDWVYLAAADALEGRELIVVLMPDAESADEAETMLNHYLEARMRETRNYLPDAYQALSEASVVRQDCLLILSVAAPEADEAALLLAEE